LKFSLNVHIFSSRYQSAIENNPKYLSQLIELAFEQFKLTARLYKQFIDHSSRVTASPGRYQHGIIWTLTQSILVQLLEEYLDTRQAGQSGVSTQDMLDRLDINSFFARKRLLNLGFGGGETTNSSSSAGQGTGGGGGTTGSQAGNQFGATGGGGGEEQNNQRRLFTFKGSSHAMSINSYIREQNNEDLFMSGRDYMSEDSAANKLNAQNNASQNEQRVFKILVCQPDHRNITTIFATMEHIVKDISDEMRTMPVEQRPELTLDKFLQEFILTKFITNAVESIKENARIHSSSVATGSKASQAAAAAAAAASFDSSVNIYDISKQLISLQKQKELGLSRPILESILLVFHSCTDLFNLIKDMNSYASEFTHAMYALIERHAAYCNQLLMSIVSSGGDDNPASATYVYSMIWVQDEAIKTYFKQLPAFSSAIKNRPTPAAQLAASSRNTANISSQQNHLVMSGLHGNNMSTATTNLDSQNPAVLAAKVQKEQFNVELWSKECETLIGNLNDVNRDLEEGDLITNYNFIEMIAHLHESSDWLIVQLKFIIGSLEQMVKNPKTLNNSLSLTELNRLVKQLDELDKWRGDTLLLLYLEIRVHCFFHLMNFIRQEGNSLGSVYAGDVDTDPDECVLRMNRDLHRIYEHLARSLQESKVNYIFDG
jgi:exocyst complex component 4